VRIDPEPMYDTGEDAMPFAVRPTAATRRASRRTPRTSSRSTTTCAANWPSCATSSSSRAGHFDAGRARSLINTMTMRQNNWTLGAYCESYCRVVTTHHTIEDRSLFPDLRARDAGLAPVIDRLAEEHHVIATVLDDVDRALVALVTESRQIGALRRAVDLLSDTLTSHLSYEERMLLEPLARFGIF
jgi:hypothetical protein